MRGIEGTRAPVPTRDNVPMSTVFENIISGQWPGRFSWVDEECIVLSTIAPIAQGHVMVIPREPWPKWTDAPPEVVEHLLRVARIVAVAQERAFEVPRAGLMIAGFEVPHTHVHVIPMRTEADIAFANAHEASAEDLDEAAQRLRAQLVADGYGMHVPADMGSAALM